MPPTSRIRPPLLAEARNSGQVRSGGREFSFENTKAFEGGQFGGGAKESFKSWSKKVKLFLNSQRRRLGQALELAEE